MLTNAPVKLKLIIQILNILIARQTKGEKMQPSTGVAEDGGHVLIRSVSSDIATVQAKNWSLLKGVLEEANMINQLIFQCSNSSAESSPANDCVGEDEDMDEMFSVLNEAMDTEDWDKVKYMLEDMILLITNPGGQTEFLDLLIQGPSFNLLFSRLVDHLDSQFKIYYTNEDGECTKEEDSTVTMEEVLFQALSSIACFSNAFRDDDDKMCLL